MRDFFAGEIFSAAYCLILDTDEGMGYSLDDLDLFVGLRDRLLFFLDVADFLLFCFEVDRTGVS